MVSVQTPDCPVVDMHSVHGVFVGKSRSVRVVSKGQITLEVLSGTDTVKVTIYTRDLRTWRQSEGDLYQPEFKLRHRQEFPCSIVETIKKKER